MIKDKFLTKMSLIGSLERKLQKSPYSYFYLLRPFDNIFLMLLPLVYHWRGKMQLASLKNT